MELEFKLFVVFHNSITRNYYSEDLNKNYIFINVNPSNDLSTKELKKEFEVINQYELKEFLPLGKWYTESEVIYNIYKNKYIYENLDFIGFLQYDIDSTKLRKNNITTILETYDHINFEPHLFEADFQQKILMDITQPNKRNGNGINCYEAILQDYNKFYRTQFTLDDLSGKTLNLCSAFILRKNIFLKMMEFISYIIEEGILEIFDNDHIHRIQGGLLERYYGVWIALNNLKSTTIYLEHKYEETQKQNSFLNRVLRKLGIKR